MSRDNTNNQPNLAVFSTFDKEIKDAVQDSEVNKNEDSVRQLKTIKDMITGTMLSNLSYIKDEFEFGISLLDEQIAQAESRCDEANKGRLFSTNNVKDYATPDNIKSSLGY